MNKNMKVILGIGLVAILVLMLVSMFMLQQVPVVKQSQDLSGRIQFLFDLEKVRIVQMAAAQGIRYRLLIRPRTMLTDSARKRLVDAVGHYLWQNPPSVPPAEVWVVCQEQHGGACASQFKNSEYQVLPPVIPGKKRP